VDLTKGKTRMNTPYLIQQAEIYDDPETKGLDSILDFDYMGSAEFEYGALAKSLKEIRKDIEEYVFSNVEIETKSISVFCKKADLDEIVSSIRKLAKNEIHLKEWIDFSDWLNYKKVRNKFWWDIGNNFMFWASNAEFELKFLQVIG